MSDIFKTALQHRAERLAEKLIGPAAPYSKIGGDRRDKLRAKIVAHLVEFYKDGYIAGGNDTIKAIRA